MSPAEPAPGDGGLPEPARQMLEALPAGTQALAAQHLQAGLLAAGRPDLVAGWTGSGAVARQLVLPLLDTDHWPGPNPPLPVASGAVHADLIDTDHDQLATLRSILAAEGALEPEILASRAQEWRLPVTPYRRLAPSPAPGSCRPAGAAGSGSTTWPDPTGTGGSSPGETWEQPPLVVDLSSLWAGPLATGLLARLGARVIKLDPGCRPDGFRVHPRLYQGLNGAKEIVDLDLRRPDHRARFEALVAKADLVVDSFSRRVMPNLGYGPAALRSRNPKLATLSIVAFPAGTAEQDWVSYGPGVHAASGLGTTVGPDGAVRFQPARLAYPDALAGLAAFALATLLLSPAGAGGGTHGRGAHGEVSLAGAIAPLATRAAAQARGGTDDG
jgi:hypothetical protein